MSDKVRDWVGSGRGASRPELIDDDITRYVVAKVHVKGSTHIGQMINGICFQLCNTARNAVLMPVAKEPVECEQCLLLMKRMNISVNMSVRFEQQN